MSQWQNDLNSLPVHLRREPAMKAELHCKVDVSLTMNLYMYICSCEVHTAGSV